MSCYTPRKKDKWLYSCSRVLWALSALYAVIQLFIPYCPLPALILICVLLFLSLLSSMHKELNLWPGRPLLPIDLAVIVTGIAGAIMAVLCFIVLFDGYPEIVDGVYSIVNHGNFVRQVTQNEYRWLTLCNKMLFPCGLLAISALVTHHCGITWFLQVEYAAKQQRDG